MDESTLKLELLEQIDRLTEEHDAQAANHADAHRAEILSRKVPMQYRLSSRSGSTRHPQRRYGRIVSRISALLSSRSAVAGSTASTGKCCAPLKQVLRQRPKSFARVQAYYARAIDRAPLL